MTGPQPVDASFESQPATASSRQFESQPVRTPRRYETTRNARTKHPSGRSVRLFRPRLSESFFDRVADRGMQVAARSGPQRQLQGEIALNDGVKRVHPSWATLHRNVGDKLEKRISQPLLRGRIALSRECEQSLLFGTAQRRIARHFPQI